MNKLPDFVVIGASKCGTTSLYVNLGKHPQISMSDPKEVHFFDMDVNWKRGSDWYKKHFKKSKKICGEATSTYIYFTQYHKRMFQTIPNAKLILVLRDPVDRAYSQWNHWKNLDKDDKKIDKKTNKKPKVLAHEIRKLLAVQTFSGKPEFEKVISSEIGNLHNKKYVPMYGNILQKGFYINQIKQLLKYYKRSDLHVIISERMKSNPKKEYRKIFKFLGVDERVGIAFEDANVIKYQAPMKEKTRSILNKIYRHYNKRLYDFLGYKINEWGK